MDVKTHQVNATVPVGKDPLAVSFTPN
ncbi:hypothetical protein ACSVDA_18555 [Cytobacillus sp. Hm23]